MEFLGIIEMTELEKELLGQNRRMSIILGKISGRLFHMDNNFDMPVKLRQYIFDTIEELSEFIEKEIYGIDDPKN